MTGNEKFRLKVVDDLRKNRVIVESDEDYITLLKKANSDLGDLVRLRDEQIAKLTAERDELLAALDRCRFALEPYDDIKPRDWKSDRLNLRDAHQEAVAAIASVKGEQ